ncbi:MAG: prepilin-type N-terminal cleavage/methylation domain-containing protein [Planctomycetaceae bacterium]|nr:prepilin-type N-terminal cleavage/methylation domain-containing protein [Planctomycetaceae bacterium]
MTPSGPKAVLPPVKGESYKGFTLIELMVTMSIISVVTLAAGMLLAGGQHNWNRLYGRVYGDPATDSFLIQRVFDAICNKASLRKCVIGEGQDSLEVYYWDHESIADTPENYARIYREDADVFLEHGRMLAGTWQVDTESETNSLVLAHAVDQLIFAAQDTALRMYLTYQDPNILPVVSSAVRHNK